MMPTENWRRHPQSKDNPVRSMSTTGAQKVFFSAAASIGSWCLCQAFLIEHWKCLRLHLTVSKLETADHIYFKAVSYAAFATPLPLAPVSHPVGPWRESARSRMSPRGVETEKKMVSLCRHPPTSRSQSGRLQSRGVSG